MRIRQIDDQFIQTVKSSGKAVGGLHQRNEDEVEIESEQLDITRITEPYLQILVEEAFEEGGEFHPCFNTNFYRSTCVVAFSDGTKIEIALDKGIISADNASIDICEVELELIEGSAEYIFAIGRYLIKELDLTLYNASKASRGYSLCKKLTPGDYKMQVAELSQGVASEKVFEYICSSGLRHWQHYELYLDKKNAHSAILEMYRALIYLQHMYMVFGSLIPRQATHDLRKNWAWLANAMRPVVDAAKHMRYLSQYLKRKADWDLVGEQQKKIQLEAETAISEFKTLLSTQRYNLMMLNMSEWLFFQEWRKYIPEKQKGTLETPIVDYARKQLDHMLKDLKRDLGPKQDLSPQDYYKMIARIRRALDTGLFFGGLFDTQKRLSYRQPWLDMLNGIRELQANDYIFELQLETHPRDEAEEWLAKLNQPVLEAIAQTRKSAFKSNPYWS